MFRDKGQRTNEAHVKHVVTAFVRLFAVSPTPVGVLGAADDKELNYPAALAATSLQPVGMESTKEKEAAAAAESTHSFISRFRLWPRESPRH